MTQKLPEGMETVGETPRTGPGKIHRTALRGRFAQVEEPADPADTQPGAAGARAGSGQEATYEK